MKSPSPTIETERLQIVPFSEEHLTTRYLSWLNDSQVMRYSEQRHSNHTIESCREYWLTFSETANHFWSIVVREVRQGYIGTMTGYVDSEHLVADVGILIGERTSWGKGYGSEAWIAVCNYLLDEGGMRKVTAGTLSPNAAMLGVMRRAGMVEDGRRVRQCLFEGCEVDVVYTALFREDWKERTDN